MPNYVRNIMRAEAENPEELHDFLSKVCDEKRNLRFQKIVPMPSSLNVIDGSIKDSALSALFMHPDTSELDRLRIKKILRTRFSRFDPANISPAVKAAYRKWTEGGRKHQSWTFEPLEEDPGLSLKETEQEDLLFDQLSEYGKLYLRNFKQYGEPTWYSWRIKKWGTKWDACNCRTQIDGNVVSFDFDTAYSFPQPIVEKLISMFPNIRFSGVYADEDIGHNCGWWDVSDGHLFVVEVNTVEFAAQVWGYDEEDIIREYDE